MALGGLAHNALLAGLSVRKKDFPFGHGAQHRIDIDGRSLSLADSYHCSRYNTNTGRLTTAMFEDVFRAVRERVAAA